MNEFIGLEPLSLGALTLNLLLGAILSAAAALYYARFGEALSNRAKLAKLLPVLCLITTLVISVVKASLALSLGLVGALVLEAGLVFLFGVQQPTAWPTAPWRLCPLASWPAPAW